MFRKTGIGAQLTWILQLVSEPKIPYGTMYPYPFRGRSYGKTTRFALHFTELKATRLSDKLSSLAHPHWIHFRFPTRFVFRLNLIGKHFVVTRKSESNRHPPSFNRLASGLGRSFRWRIPLTTNSFYSIH